MGAGLGGRATSSWALIVSEGLLTMVFSRVVSVAVLGSGRSVMGTGLGGRETSSWAMMVSAVEVLEGLVTMMFSGSVSMAVLGPERLLMSVGSMLRGSCGGIEGFGFKMAVDPFI